MPVAREHLLHVSFVAVRVRLASLISHGSLVAASIDAYAASLPELAHRVPADALSASALIAVGMTEPTDAIGMVVLPVRWHATGTGGQPVRVLDADLMLFAARANRTVLQLHGAFRLPFVCRARKRTATGSPSAPPTPAWMPS